MKVYYVLIALIALAPRSYFGVVNGSDHIVTHDEDTPQRLRRRTQRSTSQVTSGGRTGADVVPHVPPLGENDTAPPSSNRHSTGPEEAGTPQRRLSQPLLASAAAHPSLPTEEQRVLPYSSKTHSPGPEEANKPLSHLSETPKADAAPQRSPPNEGEEHTTDDGENQQSASASPLVTPPEGGEHTTDDGENQQSASASPLVTPPEGGEHTTDDGDNQQSASASPSVTPPEGGEDTADDTGKQPSTSASPSGTPPQGEDSRAEPALPALPANAVSHQLRSPAGQTQPEDLPRAYATLYMALTRPSEFRIVSESCDSSDTVNGESEPGTSDGEAAAGTLHLPTTTPGTSATVPNQRTQARAPLLPSPTSSPGHKKTKKRRKRMTRGVSFVPRTREGKSGQAMQATFQREQRQVSSSVYRHVEAAYIPLGYQLYQWPENGCPQFLKETGASLNPQLYNSGVTFANQAAPLPTTRIQGHYLPRTPWHGASSQPCSPCVPMCQPPWAPVNHTLHSRGTLTAGAAVPSAHQNGVLRSTCPCLQREGANNARMSTSSVIYQPAHMFEEHRQIHEPTVVTWPGAPPHTELGWDAMNAGTTLGISQPLYMFQEHGQLNEPPVVSWPGGLPHGGLGHPVWPPQATSHLYPPNSGLDGAIAAAPYTPQNVVVQGPYSTFELPTCNLPYSRAPPLLPLQPVPATAGPGVYCPVAPFQCSPAAPVPVPMCSSAASCAPPAAGVPDNSLQLPQIYEVTQPGLTVTESPLQNAQNSSVMQPGLYVTECSSGEGSAPSTYTTVPSAELPVQPIRSGNGAYVLVYN